jgi:3-oxoacyl-[acyl-carrier-protein] synthase III
VSKKGDIMSLRIAGIGRGIPKKQVSNDDLAGFLDTGDEWI